MSSKTEHGRLARKAALVAGTNILETDIVDEVLTQLRAKGWRWTGEVPTRGCLLCFNLAQVDKPHPRGFRGCPWWDKRYRKPVGRHCAYVADLLEEKVPQYLAPLQSTGTKRNAEDSGAHDQEPGSKRSLRPVTKVICID